MEANDYTMKALWVSSFVLLILFGGKSVKGQNEVCSITTYYWDDTSRSSSSKSLVGRFPLKFGDNSDPLLKNFLHSESGVDVHVGVEEVTGLMKKDYRRLRLAISFAGKPEDVFDEVTRAEAETIYDRNWKWVSVSKSIRIRNRVYTYTFDCQREKSGS